MDKTAPAVRLWLIRGVIKENYMPGVNRNAPRVDTRTMAVMSRGYDRVRARPLIVQNTRP